MLHRPVQRQVNMRGEFQIRQCFTLGDRFDDLWREKRQPDQTGSVATANAVATGNRSQRGHATGDQLSNHRWARGRNSYSAPRAQTLEQRMRTMFGEEFGITEIEFRCLPASR